MTEPTEPSRISALLSLASAGCPKSLEQVFELAYPELCTLAGARLRTRDPHLSHLESSALVHETYLRIVQRGAIQAEHRPQFFKYAAHVMRSVIVDTVRNRRAQRRGSGAEHVPLADREAGSLGSEEDVLHVHEAIDALAEQEPRLFDVVQLRYFGGMTDAEIGEVLGITDRTVRRDWERARALLSVALQD